MSYLCLEGDAAQLFVWQRAVRCARLYREFVDALQHAHHVRHVSNVALTSDED
jgi:hypothetical protein